jgi:hypothetical protein
MAHVRKYLMNTKIYKLLALFLLAALFTPSVFVVGDRTNAQSSAPLVQVRKNAESVD